MSQCSWTSEDLALHHEPRACQTCVKCDYILSGSRPDQLWENICGNAKKYIPHCGSLCQIPVLSLNILEAVGLFNEMDKAEHFFNLGTAQYLTAEGSYLIVNK